MRKENVRCPMCGTMNYDVDLDETGGWTKCRLCKAVTCSMEEWKKHKELLEHTKNRPWNWTLLSSNNSLNTP